MTQSGPVRNLFLQGQMTMQAWSPDPGGTNYGLKARMPITSVIFVSRHSTQTENYGTRRRNLDYFRKCRTPARKKQARITEVEAGMSITSVIFVSRHSIQTENYGSRRRNLDYFRKCRAPARKSRTRLRK